MTSRILSEKINRLGNGETPRVLDLFSGCGGLSLGFKTAKYQVVGAIESNQHAAASHGLNFHSGDKEHSKSRDMEKSPVEQAMLLSLGHRYESEIDVLVGGPPCQAFARVGRAKLRDIHKHPEAYRNDPRARLYQRYLEYVEAFQPLAILIENVPDVIRFGSTNVPEEICEILEDLGYQAAYTLLNSAHYGVPQFRERMFLIAYHRELGTQVSFPEPTHRVSLPKGYRDFRKGTLGRLSSVDMLRPRTHAVAPPVPGEHLPPAITAEEALHDLPPIIGPSRNNKTPPSHRDKGKIRPYDGRRSVSDYARAMKEWSGYESDEGIEDHVIRILPRDWGIFARMREGDRYPQAIKVAENLFEENLRKRRASSEKLAAESDEWLELRRRFVPPYPVDKFKDKWRKLVRREPVWTVTAHLSKDCYSHIHYDSSQARTISIREAARLQSFPDGFMFTGPMNAAYRQIGNAVPPLMAKALALHMRKVICSSTELRDYLPARSVRA